MHIWFYKNTGTMILGILQIQSYKDHLNQAYTDQARFCYMLARWIRVGVLDAIKVCSICAKLFGHCLNTYSLNHCNPVDNLSHVRG